MGLFDKLIGGSGGSEKNLEPKNTSGLIDYGRNRNTGGHDHRTNTGDDRTPAQREGDKKRRK